MTHPPVLRVSAAQDQSVRLESIKDADKAFALTYGNYHYGIDAVELMKRMTADEASRPSSGQYVFVHILLPHGPFNIDARIAAGFDEDEMAALQAAVGGA